MKALKKILLILGIIVLVIVIIGFCLPSKAHVERSIVIKAPEDVVFEEVNTLKNWEKWSPWQKFDPHMSITYQGPASGTGAGYSWASNNAKVGNGTLTIKNSGPDSIVNAEMDFKEHGTATADFKFSKTSEGTMVSWTMNSDLGMNPFKHYFGIMMDKMVGPEFEDGLTRLKNETEQMLKTDMENIKVEELTTTPMNALTINVKCKMSEISSSYGEAYGRIMTQIQKSGLHIAGSPFAIFNTFSPAGVDMDPGIPTNEPGKSEGDIKAVEMKAQKAIKVKYTGPYLNLKIVYAALDQYIKDHKMKMNGPAWEVYINDPMTEKDSSKLITEVYYPVK